MAHPAIDLPVEELTVDERLTLLGRLWDSLLDAGPPPVPAWHLDEVRRRLSIADTDPDAFISLEELRQKILGERI